MFEKQMEDLEKKFFGKYRRELSSGKYKGFDRKVISFLTQTMPKLVVGFAFFMGLFIVFTRIEAIWGIERVFIFWAVASLLTFRDIARTLKG